MNDVTVHKATKTELVSRKAKLEDGKAYLLESEIEQLDKEHFKERDEFRQIDWN